LNFSSHRVPLALGDDAPGPAFLELSTHPGREHGAVDLRDLAGVAVTDGAVTLTGHVPTYAEKLAAARAAERVYGVKAVANDLTVKLAGAPRDDSDIATAIAHVLESNVQVPEGRVHARVEHG
jgi:DICT domain-containing protein